MMQVRQSPYLGSRRSPATAAPTSTMVMMIISRTKLVMTKAMALQAETVVSAVSAVAAIAVLISGLSGLAEASSAAGEQPTGSSVGEAYRELLLADANLDMITARERALSIVAADATSAEAAAAISWWSASLDWLPEPEQILAVAGTRRDPSASLGLSRIEAELVRRAPVGSLAMAELAGPFGVFDALDLERDVAPDDEDLPRLGTPWRGAADPFRLRIRSADGWIGPEGAMVTSGVYLAAWALEAKQRFDGWLIVEVRGGFNLELDGIDRDSRRYCGAEAAGATWYRLRLEPGPHRLRIAMASLDEPQVRVSLLDDHGAPPTMIELVDQVSGPWAAAEIRPELPPAESRLLAALEAEPGRSEAGPDDPGPADQKADGWLLSAALARLRGDALEERQRLEKGLELRPDATLIHLALAELFLERFTGADGSTDARRCDEHLRQAAELPMSLLIARTLAVVQNRDEDAERLLDELVDGGHEDPRVLAEWVREAVGRSWVREAEQGLEHLQVLAPGAWGVSELRLGVLEGLERWEDRNRLLLALAEIGPDRLWLVDRLATTCHQDEALAMLDRIRSKGDDPVLDLGAVRMLAQAGEYEQARARLELAAERWGDLSSFDHYRVILAGGDVERTALALEEAIRREPWNLDLHSLALRLGQTPFYEELRVRDAVGDARAAGDEVDKDTDAVLLLDQAVERIYEDGSSIYYYHGLTRVLTSAGARQASTLQHIPGTRHLNVRIIKPDGSVVIPPELEPGGSTFELADLKAGDLLEEQYVASLEPTGASRRGHLSPYTYRFADSERAFGLSEYILLVPKTVELDIDGSFEGLIHREWDLGELRAMSWRSEEMPPIPSEPFAPPESELLPWITYSFGVTWQDVGDAVRDRVLPVLRSSPELNAWVDRVVQGESPLERLAALVTALIDDIDGGAGQLDLDTTAGASFTRQEGNRLAILASGLIRSGFKVDLVLTRPFAMSGTHRLVPSPDVFLQPILRIEADGETLWVDLEEERQGVNHISPALQRSDGLVLPLSHPREQVSIIEELPELENPDIEDRQELRVVLDADGHAEVDYRVPLHGAQAERMLEHVRSVPAERAQQVFQQVGAQIFPGSTASSGSIERTDRGALLELDLILGSACEKGSDRMTCRSLVVVNPISQVLATLPERRHPLILGVPVERVIETELELPRGWTLNHRPRLLEASWGSVHEILEPTENGVRSIVRLSMPAQVVAPEDYPVFARFCHAVDELMTRPLQPRLVAGS